MVMPVNKNLLICETRTPLGETAKPLWVMMIMMMIG